MQAQIFGEEAIKYAICTTSVEPRAYFNGSIQLDQLNGNDNPEGSRIVGVGNVEIQFWDQPYSLIGGSQPPAKGVGSGSVTKKRKGEAMFFDRAQAETTLPSFPCAITSDPSSATHSPP